MKRSGDELPRRIALDTSAYSHLRRGDMRIIDLVAAAVSVLVPVTVIGELEAAFRRGSRCSENLGKLRSFLRDPLVSVIVTDEAIAHRYGRLFAALRELGTPIPINDVWIAAATLTHGAHLVTFDHDFERVPELELTVLVAAS